MFLFSSCKETVRPARVMILERAEQRVLVPEEQPAAGTSLLAVVYSLDAERRTSLPLDEAVRTAYASASTTTTSSPGALPSHFWSALASDKSEIHTQSTLTPDEVLSPAPIESKNTSTSMYLYLLKIFDYFYTKALFLMKIFVY